MEALRADRDGCAVETSALRCVEWPSEGAEKQGLYYGIFADATLTCGAWPVWVQAKNTFSLERAILGLPAPRGDGSSATVVTAPFTPEGPTRRIWNAAPGPRDSSQPT